ncbi:MAG: hypothetical protein ACHREM_32675 [Polyangiales bacterium]
MKTPALLVVALVLLVACGCSSSSSAPALEGDACSISSSGSDCAPGLYCLDGVCRRRCELTDGGPASSSSCCGGACELELVAGALEEPLCALRSPCR